MKRLLALLALLALVALCCLSLNAAEPRRIPVPPKLIIQTSHQPGTAPLVAVIRWKIGHQFDYDYLEMSTQPSGGVWEPVPGPYFKVGDEYVVPIFLNDSPKNRRFYRVYRENVL